MKESTRTDDGFDPALAALFAEEHRQIPEEPFVGRTLQQVTAEHRLMRRVRRFSALAALIAVIGVSPWLIEASVTVSTALDTAFALVSRWLSTPIGAIAALVIGALVAAGVRSRLWR